MAEEKNSSAKPTPPVPPGRGRGRQPGGFGFGPPTECVCPECGAKVPHQRGVPCYSLKCPKCGARMIRGR